MAKRGKGKRFKMEVKVSVKSISPILVLALLLIMLSSARAQDGPSGVSMNPKAVNAPLQDGRPAVLRDVGIDQRLNEQVPLDLVFRDESGRSVPLREYFGSKPVILALVYYQCPMLCTMVLNGLLQSLNVLSFNAGNQFTVVSVSFDPRETPQLAATKKESYLKRYVHPGMAEGWHFLTGEEDSIKRLTKAVGFRYAYDAKNDQFAHASGIIVLTPEGKVSRYFYGVEYSPRDLRLGLVEASENKIGSPVDQILLFCYHYDPSTGKYGPIIRNFIRLGGALTVIALATLLAVMWRMERKKKVPDEEYSSLVTRH